MASQNPHELLAGHLLFFWPLFAEAGDELHDVVVVDERRVEEHELEIELFHRVVGVLALALAGLEVLGKIEVHAAEGAQVVLVQSRLDGLAGLGVEIGVLVELGAQALHLLEALDEGGAGLVALEIRHLLRFAFQALRLHEVLELLHRLGELLGHLGGRIHQPDLARSLACLAGKEGDGLVHGGFLGAKVEDVAVGLGIVEHPVGAGEGLDQTVVLEVLVHVEGVQVLRIETGEQHIHDDGEIDFLLVRQILVGVLLVLDALLDVLVIAVEGEEVEVGAVAGVVVGDDGFEGLLLLVGFLAVVGQLLGQVFLQLGDVAIAIGGRGEDAGDVEGLEVFVFRLALGLNLLEQVVVLDGVVDAGRGKKRVEAALVGGLVVFVEDRFHHFLLGQSLAGFDRRALGLVVIHVEAQHVAVVDGMGDGVGVELFAEDVGGGDHAGLLPLDGAVGGVLLEDRRAGEAKELGLRKELADGPVVLAKLGAVALVEDKDDALVA